MDYKKRRRKRGSWGQAAVELALVMSLLMTLAVGIFDVGRAFSTMVQVDAMAKGGARVGIEQDIPMGQAGCTGSNNQLNCANSAALYIGGGGSDADIGAAIREEAGKSSGLLWGLASSGQVEDNNCINSPGEPLICGDTSGCSINSPFWTDNTLPSLEPASACFAVATAYYYQGEVVGYVTAANTYSSTPVWNVRPTCATPVPPENLQCWQTGTEVTITNPNINNGVPTPVLAYLALDVRVVLKFQTVTPYAGDLIGNNGVIYLSRDALALPVY